MNKVVCAASCAAVVAFAGVASGQFEYVLDDGVAETQSALSQFDAQVIFGNVFEVQPGGETITSVSTVIAEGLGPGFAFSIGIWDDPNDDGNPLDADLVSLTSHVVQDGFIDAGTFESFGVGEVDVEGEFFVGFLVDVLIDQPYARQDLNLLGPGPVNTGFESWTFFDPIGSGNTDLGAALGPNNNGAFGLGTWAVRATGVPAPGALGLLPLGALALRRTR